MMIQPAIAVMIVNKIVQMKFNPAQLNMISTILNKIMLRLPPKFCIWYHRILVIIGFLVAIAGVYLSQRHEGVSHAESIFMTIAVFVAGSLCFLIVPLMVIVGTYFVRFGAILGLPAYAILYIGYLLGDNADIGYVKFLIATSATLWGWFNICTAITAKQHDEFI